MSMNRQTSERHYDSINEFAVVGEFGFQRVRGPFEVTKDGTVWEVVVPHEMARQSPTIEHLDGQEGESVALVADCEIVGGGILTKVLNESGTGELVLLVDQYAMGDPT